MKKFIKVRLREANFSTPSEYIRSLIRFDQQRSSQEAFVRGGLRKAVPAIDDAAGSTIENALRPRKGAKRTNGRNRTKRGPSKV